MSEIVEQRLKPTIIRRRAKKEEEVVVAPPPPPSQVSQEVAPLQPVVAKPAPEPALPKQAIVHPLAEVKVEEKIPQPQPSVKPAQTVATHTQAQTPPVGGKPVSKHLHKPEVKQETRSYLYSSKVKLADASVASSIGPGLRVIRQDAPVKPPEPKGRTIVSGRVTVMTPAAKEAEEKFKRGPKKKLSKAEMNFEDIKRAGGLMHYVKSEDVVVDENAPIVEPPPVERNRVFQPTYKKKKHLKRAFVKNQLTEMKASKKNIKVSDAITISELSQSLGVKSSELIKKLFDLGVMATINQAIDVDTATLLSKDYGYEIEHTAFKEEQVFEVTQKKKDANVMSRPPVVTVMGHVDHGKTSVLDYIRKTKVVDGEAGGITQHIGAYEVKTPKGSITFIDTPGHAAFTSMRARGAKVTDIVILVVAADDGVMPQTKEAIDHARAANVPIIVAINKIDKPDANIERVKRSLSEYNILPEEWGGDVICVGTSAKTGVGIDQLLEMVILQSEVMELKSDAGAAAKGAIIEAKLDRGLGPVATILVQGGTLKQGSTVVCGLHYGKVRTLINSRGEVVESAGPSTAVSLIGLSGVPMAGDEFIEVEDEKVARQVSETRQHKQRALDLNRQNTKVTLEELGKQVTAGTVEELNVVLKADVHGSIEAIKEALNKLSTDKVKISVLHAGVGGVTESDVMLATASKAIIIGFNVVPETGVGSLAESEGVQIRRYSIIYDLIDEVKKSMEGLLAPILLEKITGHAQVRQVFTVSKVGTIAGCMIVDGKVPRTASARLVRDSVIVWTGKLASLKRFKDDAKEVSEGNDCGIGLEGYNDIKVGDVIEAFIIESIAQKLA